MITIPHYSPVYNVDLWFNGLTNCVRLENSKFPITQITFECWIKTSMNTPGTILSYVVQTTNVFTILDVTNLNFFINGMQVSTTGTGISVNDGEWHFLSVTWNGVSGELFVYKDGIYQNRYVVAPGTFLLSGGTLVTGQSQLADPKAVSFEGNLAEVRIWNKARTHFFINQDIGRTIPPMNAITLWQLVYLEVLQVNKYVSVRFTSVAPTIPVDFTKEGAVYATDSNNLVWLSTDFGKTWTQPNAATRLIQVSAISAVAMGVDSSFKVYASTDAGKTWTQPNPGAGLSQVAVTTNFVIGVNSSQAVYYSADYGKTWNPGDSQKLVFVATDSTASWGIDSQGALYKSTTRLASQWTRTTAPPLIRITSLGNTLVGVTSTGLISVSEDGGNSWITLPQPYSRTFTFASLLKNVLWAIDSNGYMVFAEFNTQMLLHWMLDEGYGDVAFDGSGNGNSGVLGAKGTPPSWKVSSMLVQPRFAVDPYSLSSPEILLAAPEPVTTSQPKVKAYKK